MTREQINEYIEASTEQEGILLLDGLDDAFIGLTTDENVRAVYSVNKIIENLSKDMSEEDAWDYYGFNIECAYVGEKTPLYIRTL